MGDDVTVMITFVPLVTDAVSTGPPGLEPVRYTAKAEGVTELDASASEKLIVIVVRFVLATAFKAVGGVPSGMTVNIFTLLFTLHVAFETCNVNSSRSEEHTSEL